MFLTFILLACSNNSTSVLEDIEKSSISCSDAITITIPATKSETLVTYEKPIITSNVNVSSLQTKGLESGELFPVGTTTNTFVTQDAAGRDLTCSFDVVVQREDPTPNGPYIIGEDITPRRKKWVKVAALSDEFNGTAFDDTKWHRYPEKDGFNWIGRTPGLFEADNVSVSNGNMNVTVEKFNSPKTVKNMRWTHGGAIVRSKQLAKPGNYYETRMKANSTIMSSTFWISFKDNCNTGPVRKLELDIQECVGRVHKGTANWAKNFSNIYASNTWRHDRKCDTKASGAKQSSSKTVLDEKNNSRYFVYGCWWKSPKEILFYLDGKFTHSIKPPTDFDLDGHITMAIETYNWNPIDKTNDLIESGSFDERTTKYDWIRTWELQNK